MKKDKIEAKFISPHLKEGEELIGFFMARKMPPIWKILLLGAWATLKSVHYIAITNRGLHVNRPLPFGKPTITQFYPYSQISTLVFKWGLFEQPFELQLMNGEKSLFRAQTRGGKRVPKLDDQMKGYLLSKISDSKIA